MSFYLLVFTFACVFGYRIDDESCHKEGIWGMVQDALISAFDMAQSAHDRLTADRGMSQSTLDLVGQILARPGEDPKLADTSKTVDVFANIRQHYRGGKFTQMDMDSEDIVSVLSCRKD